jgi:nucleotide-binding universal stress UspA family protein
VLHVVAPVVPAVYGAPINAQEITADLERQSRHLLQKLRHKAEKAAIPVDMELKFGVIDREILDAVQVTRSDIVVMGTHGRRGFERWVMGSVTERMMRNCPVPLLTVGSIGGTRSSPFAIRRILATTDFSEGTAETLKYAFSFARECQAKLTLLHVVSDLSASLGSKLTSPLILSIRKKLEDLVPAEVRGWCDVATRVEVGEPYRVILDIIGKEKPGLVVMNVHGKSLAERALIGSTAERVVRAAVNTCPALLIPPARTAKKARKAA